MKIAVGMSGGVDSSVAALLLKKQGHAVSGVTMRIWRGDDNGTAKRHACYGPGEEQEIRRAREICDAIGIRHHVCDLSEAYERTVLSYFKREYRNGRTPNPCVVCNHRMKFGLLPELTGDITGAEAFATGHYARINADNNGGRAALRRARDKSKDQTYFLHRLSQDQIRRALFPLGDHLKEEVRGFARDAGIPSWEDPESQDFYNGDYTELIGAGGESGDIVDAAGRVLGTHRGIWNYTVGQRRGLGIAAVQPLYVTAIDAARRRVIVAPKDESLRREFLATQFNWVSVDSLDGSRSLTVKTRSAQRDAPCGAEMIDGDTLRIVLEDPEGGIAPGQSAVLYDGDLVVGGGIIEYA